MPKLRKNPLKFLALAIFFASCLNVYSQDKVQKIDELVQKYYQLGQFNGALLVAENGKIIYSKATGYADMENSIPINSDTKFRLASITKQFTAVLILQLVEKGKIKLDDNLLVYLPYYRKDTGGKITIAQILSHTSGLANYTSDQEFMQEKTKIKTEPKEFVLKYCSEDLVYEPGTNWEYSNSGYFILGLVIEEVTGKTYEENLRENIFEPLGMTNSGLENSDLAYENKAKGYSNMLGEYKPARFLDMTIPFSAGSVYSTTEDMYKWDQALYTEKILKKETIEKMFTPVLNEYGFGWHVGEQPVGDMKKKVVMHSGGIFGFSSLEVRLVDDRNFIIALNNIESASLSQLTLGITNILYGLEPAQPREDLALVLIKNLKDKDIGAAITEVKKLKENKEKYRTNENSMNILGYTMLQQGKIKEAVEIFKLNTEWYPESSNVYDSYGEALAAAGDIENAIINYRKSVELDPNNVNGIKTLKKLEGK